jgi:hypothetical protein
MSGRRTGGARRRPNRLLAALFGLAGLGVGVWVFRSRRSKSRNPR